MTSILLVEHNGNIKPVKSKDLSREVLYKKCGFKSAEHFDKTAVWAVEYNSEVINIELWAKTEGKANNENKYDFPPPVDNKLYYGTCALLRVDGKGNIIHLTGEIWQKVYEKLFGGFEDIDEDEEEGDEEDDEEEDDEDEDEDIDNDTANVAVPKNNKTKNGYIKDDFVVEDEEDAEGENNDSEEDNVKRTVVKKKHDLIDDANKSEDEDIYYGSELEEEAYSYSDEDD